MGHKEVFVIGWKWPKSGSKVGLRAFSLQEKSTPKPSFDPLLGHFQAMKKNPFLTLLWQINGFDDFGFEGLPTQSRVLERGCDEAAISEEKRFSLKEGEALHE